MNELSELRGLRADPPLADADRLAAPRARLTEAFRQDNRPERAALPRRRMILAGTATAGALAVTAGIVATLPEDSTSASARKGPHMQRGVDPLGRHRARQPGAS
jgi:hypothetical protein